MGRKSRRHFDTPSTGTISRMDNRNLITVKHATTFYERLRGLAFHDEGFLAGNEALCFVSCRSIHTFGMRFSIDVAFIDREGEVVRVARALKPGKIMSCTRSHLVIERSATSMRWFSEREMTVIISKDGKTFIQVLERSEGDESLSSV